jgi:K+-transporting ATPase KdpF subunit
MGNTLYMVLMGFLLVAVLLQSGPVIACVERGKMSVLYVISGVIALGLLVYLFVALLRPEKFG